MKLILFFATLLLPLLSTYKILVYNPKFSHSHTSSMAKIADMLAEAGHEVTSLMPAMVPWMSNYTTKSKIVHVDSAPMPSNLPVPQLVKDIVYGNVFDFMRNYRGGQFMAAVFLAQCRKLLEESRLIKQLQEEQFDVMLVEHIDVCGVGLVELIKPKAYLAVATGAVYSSIHQQEFGIPVAPSYDSAPIVSRMDVHLMWDRLVNLYADWICRLRLRFVRCEIDSLFREKFGADYPTTMEISSRSAYVFVNSEPLIDFATPIISKVIYIPGIGAQEPKSLDTNWEAVLSKRPCAILISFGSVLNSVDLPSDTKMGMIKTIKSLPDVTFIWKYEEDDDFAKNTTAEVNNLVLTKWMPQVDVLNHKNLRVFITHGGNSILEAAMRGVPAIVVPLIAENPRNAAIMERNGVGKILEKHELANSAKFTEVVKEMLDNPSYYKNAQRMATKLRAKPFSSKEQLIKYTEFAAEFGASAAFSPQSYDMNWIEYNNADIIVAGILIAIAMGLIALKLVLSIVKRGSNSK